MVVKINDAFFYNMQKKEWTYIGDVEECCNPIIIDNKVPIKMYNPFKIEKKERGRFYIDCRMVEFIYNE